MVRGISTLDAAGLATKDATIGAEGAATVDANVSNAVKVDADGPGDGALHRRPGLHPARQRLGKRQRLPIDLSERARASTPDRKFHKAPASSSPRRPLRPSGLGQAVEQRAAHRAMLDVGALVDPEEAQRLLVLDAVAVDQPFDLGAGDAGELAFVGVKRAEAGGVGLPRQAAEGVDQRLRLRD